MASVAADLKQLRLQVERLQVEVAGQKAISAMVVWDGQNESSVNQKTSRRQEEFNGLIVHLTLEPSTPEGTVKSISQNELQDLKKQIRESLGSSPS